MKNKLANGIIISYNNNIENINIEGIKFTDLYKICGHSNQKDFKYITDWLFENYIIELWGKTIGKIWEINNNMNKYNKILNLNISLYKNCIFLLKDKTGMYLNFKNEIFDNFIKKKTNDYNNMNEIQKIKTQISNELLNKYKFKNEYTINEKINGIILKME